MDPARPAKSPPVRSETAIARSMRIATTRLDVEVEILPLMRIPVPDLKIPISKLASAGETRQKQARKRSLRASK
jgi:hypothetical protein